MSGLYKGAFFVVLSALGYGLMPIFALFAYKEGVSVTTLLFMRFTLATLILFSYIFVKREKISLNRKNIASLFVLGGIGYTIISTLYFLSVKFVAVSLAALILYTFPLYVAILSYFVEGEKFTKKMVFSMLICFVGLVLMLKTSAEAINFRGVLLALGAALVYSGYIIFGNHTTKNIPSLIASAFISAFATIGLFIVGATTRTMTFSFGIRAWWSIVAIALFSTVLAILFFLKGLKVLGATRTSVLSLTEPLFSSVLAVIIFGERLTILQIIGATGVLVGAAFVVLSHGSSTSEGAVKDPKGVNENFV